jgi:hypothetical protein
MWVIIVWLFFTAVVAAAADARGRSGAAWFIVALIFSPLIGLICVLAFPNLKHQRLLEAAIAQRSAPMRLPSQLPKAGLGGKADRVTIDRTPRPFEPDGVYAGIPYRVADDGSIHAIMQGSLVRFRDFDKFTGAMGPAA